jgi:cytochrome oxidase Cu insertion factor (SCO1/SenC/PrrC family)
MATLQAWPGRGFWQGQTSARISPGDITAMAQTMSQTPQPRLFSSLVAHFATFDAAHGWAVNLFVVVSLGVIGAVMMFAGPRLLRYGLSFGILLCIADWVLIEDFGFFGGVGTDPNSMIPMCIIYVAGYLALVRPTAVGTEIVALRPEATRGGFVDRLVANPGYAFRALAACGAVAVTLLGAAPMAIASTNPNADPIVAQAVDGLPVATDAPAPAFSLVDQHGRSVSLLGLRHKVIALTFLDPVCVSDCPLIAQELRRADLLLGSDAQRVVLVAVVINPLYRSSTYTTAFDAEEGLDRLPNWFYLTGSLTQLEAVWQSYGIEVAVSSGGAMIAHNDLAYVIGTNGKMRYILNTDPGPGTSTTRSAISVTFADTIRAVLP